MNDHQSFEPKHTVELSEHTFIQLAMIVANCDAKDAMKCDLFVVGDTKFIR